MRQKKRVFLEWDDDLLTEFCILSTQLQCELLGVFARTWIYLSHLFSLSLCATVRLVWL